jgi:hypothetical protein
MSRIIRLTEQDLTRIVRRVIREEKIRSDFNGGLLVEGFGPDDLKGKTINLFDDQNKQVWDQMWYITGFTVTNFEKVITFNINKNIRKNLDSTLSFATGVMIYDCMKPDSFTVSYQKGYNNYDVTNQLRYNPDVTDKLKTEYCKYVLRATPDPSADFALQQKAGGSTVSESRRRRYRNY